MQPTLQLFSSPCQTLSLRITDPEILAELAKRTDPAEREAFAVAALRVGVLALKMASGIVDERAVRDAGRDMIQQMEAALSENRLKVTSEIASSLRAYFDSQTGSVPQMVDTLVKKDLDGMLKRHLAADGTLAQTLVGHVGAQSPLLQMLGPDQKAGLLARLEDLVKKNLEDQRAKLLGEFDLNRSESALARLVRQMKDGQGSLEKNFQETIGRLSSEWSLDNENSSVARFKKDVSGLIEKLCRDQGEFQIAVMRELEGLKARRAAEAQTTRKGATFEEALGQLLRGEAEKAREIFTSCGNNVGELKNCKKGDFTIELGPESAAPGEVIVVEAKDDIAYGLKGALEELATARPNRKAQVGVFVLSKVVAPEGMARFQRQGNDLVVIWEAEDPSSDLYVKAALEVARALIVKRAKQNAATSASFAELERIVGQLEKDASALDTIGTSAKSIDTAAGKILEEVEKLQRKLGKHLAEIRENVSALSRA